MNINTLDKKNAIHTLNLLSLVMALGVTSYFFDTMLINKSIVVIGDLLISPIYFTDYVLNSFSNYSITAHFNLVFLVLWVSYAISLRAFYPILMVKNHETSELMKWYLTKRSPSKH